jgi:hypothetical protein
MCSIDTCLGYIQELKAMAILIQNLGSGQRTGRSNQKRLYRTYGNS